MEIISENDMNSYLEIKDKYKWGIIYNFHKVEVGLLKDIKVEVGTLIQARFFDNEKELNIIRQGKVFNIYIFEDEGKEYFDKDEEHLVLQRKFRNYKTIKLRRYIKYDEDGQAYVYYVRPCELS